MLDLNPCRTCPTAPQGLPRRRHRPRLGRRGDRRGRRAVRRHRHRRQQRRHQRGRHRRGEPPTRTGRGSSTSTSPAWPGSPPPRCRCCDAPEHAAIVNLCSIAALNGLPQRALYSASQGRGAGADLRDGDRPRRRGHPGQLRESGNRSHRFVERMLQGFDDPVRERAALDARQATGRMVTPDEVAGADRLPRQPAARARRPAPRSRSTAGSRTCGCAPEVGRRHDCAHRRHATSWLHARMRTRDVRGLELTELGLGGAQFGNLYREVSDETVAATVATAWDAGVRYFDTAPHYGLGLSERRLGTLLAAHPRDEYVLSTKVGRLLVPILEVTVVTDSRGIRRPRRRPGGSGTSAVTACAARLIRAWRHWGWTGSTSSTCTIPTTTGSRRGRGSARSPGAPRPGRAGRSGRGHEHSRNR